MCRNSVVNVVEIAKESISTTVTTLLRHVYDHMETRLKCPIRHLEKKSWAYGVRGHAPQGNFEK